MSETQVAETMNRAGDLWNVAYAETITMGWFYVITSIVAFVTCFAIGYPLVKWFKKVGGDLNVEEDVWFFLRIILLTVCILGVIYAPIAFFCGIDNLLSPTLETASKLIGGGCG